ncbi:unnamed protein product [Nesidiocoris tenuis]|uniref:Uncharacterized protein n=1 Tax=Nesidiocoris tenuis TaxID=355587 RepID=A0A6H5G9B4_9HEMI|nr:unnamed protein product [Nesidiocoris tenuis]
MNYEPTRGVPKESLHVTMNLSLDYRSTQGPLDRWMTKVANPVSSSKQEDGGKPTVDLKSSSSLQQDSNCRMAKRKSSSDENSPKKKSPKITDWRFAPLSPVALQCETPTHNQTLNDTETQTYYHSRSQTHNGTETLTHDQTHNGTKTQTRSRLKNRRQTHNETENFFEFLHISITDVPSSRAVKQQEPEHPTIANTTKL